MKFSSKHLSKGLLGGVISIIIGYLGYMVFYYFYLNIILPKKMPDQIDIIKEHASLIGFIDWNWFVIYTLIFFVAGVIVIFLIEKLKKK